jgi:hypothetical protein
MALTDTVFGNVTLNKILFFCFWMLVGLVVYVILSAFIKGYEEISDVIKEFGYIHALRQQLAESIFLRLAIKGVVAIIGLFFMLVFLQFLLPLSRLCTIVAGGQLLSANGFLYAIVSFGLLWLSIHIQVVLVRLFFLRVRLWGTADPIGSSWHS